ncbi:MAG TPA: S8/S53 family peptidase, partial [Clostridia bacterium]|nr:S8/S53 family peptidase [Clostridia bacterium]
RRMALFLLSCLCLQFGCASAREAWAPDYSDHDDPNEAYYVTVLGNPEELKGGEPVIALTESAAVWKRTFAGLTEDPNFGFDLRAMDVSKVDLTGVDTDKIAFSSDTVWPENLSEGFSPYEVLEIGKNPGLGIRQLHEQGVTGAGVGIAIIDQPLFLDHQEYADRVMYYERIHCDGSMAAMHGAAVASLALGDTVGVASGAELYYIATFFGHNVDGQITFDAFILADCIRRIVEINRFLPDEEKIRVVSISRGYGIEDQGYEAMREAIALADQEGMFVITTTTEDYYHFNLLGMGRNYVEDPEDFQSYRPASWTEKEFYTGFTLPNALMVPMGSRTYASCWDTKGYEIVRPGGLSWTVPWCAGFYALCCQVKPDITPQEFIRLSMETAVTTQLEHNGRTYEFGKIINPQGVMEALKR